MFTQLGIETGRAFKGEIWELFFWLAVCYWLLMLQQAKSPWVILTNRSCRAESGFVLTKTAFTCLRWWLARSLAPFQRRSTPRTMKNNYLQVHFLLKVTSNLNPIIYNNVEEISTRSSFDFFSGLLTSSPALIRRGLSDYYACAISN